jgi:predicted nucleic acid-binding protein
MIVADTNLIAYLLIGGANTETARSVFQRDPHWVAPLLWRSELRNVLAGYLQKGELKVANAIELQIRAEEVFAGREHIVRSDRVLRLAETSSCSAYDCEFVALAKHLRVPLVTWDRRILREFPSIAVSADRFAEEPI